MKIKEEIKNVLKIGKGLENTYLHNTVGPSLSYPVPCPDIVTIFCQFFHKLVLVWCQFDMAEVKGGRLVTIGHHIAKEETKYHI